MHRPCTVRVFVRCGLFDRNNDVIGHYQGKKFFLEEVFEDLKKENDMEEAYWKAYEICL